MARITIEPTTTVDEIGRTMSMECQSRVAVEQLFQSDPTVWEMTELFGRALLACGYHPDSVKDALGEGVQF